MKDQNDSDRKLEEQTFHDRYFKGEPLRTTQAPFYNERVRQMLLSCAFSELSEMDGKRILYYGCGTNSEILLRLVQAGGYVVAIDISKQAILVMQEQIRAEGLTQSTSALQMDGEVLSFKDRTFDLIFGRAILHHLDTSRVGKELARVLTPNGKAVFIEPLGSNPIINLYRFLTPASRTSDEHPFTPEDFRQLEEHFYYLRLKPFFLFSIAAFFFKTVIKSEMLYNFFFQTLCRCDSFVVNYFPSFGKYCWTTVMTLEKVKPSQNTTSAELRR